MKERIAERIEDLVVGRKADGRCVYSEAGKRALVQACMEPGRSVAGSALANGINANLGVARRFVQNCTLRKFQACFCALSKREISKRNSANFIGVGYQLCRKGPRSLSDLWVGKMIVAFSALDTAI